MVVHAVRSSGWCVGTRGTRHTSCRCRHTAKTRCHRARKHRASSWRHWCCSGHGCGRCVEAVDGTLVVGGYHRGEWVHWPREALGAKRTRHFRGPVVVRIRRIQGVCICKGLHQSVKLSAESVLEIGRGCCGCVHCVTFAFPPLGASVLEPYLQQWTQQFSS
jgi:hypothetical protein